MAEGKPLSVIDWDRAVNKNVRSKEGEPIGSIVAHMQDSLHIETTGSRVQYMVPPKEHVTAFDGAEVALNLTVNELARFALGGGS